MWKESTFLFNAINLWWRRQVLAQGPLQSLLAISFLTAAQGSVLWICQVWPSINPDWSLRQHYRLTHRPVPGSWREAQMRSPPAAGHGAAGEVERGPHGGGELPFSQLSNRKSWKVDRRVLELPVETYCGGSSRRVNLSGGGVRVLTSTTVICFLNTFFFFFQDM